MNDGIGVVMPTHPRRVERGFTQRALMSAFKQSLPPSALCIYNDVEHKGAPYSRHQALMMNNEKWTAFLDSDDYFHVEHLATLMNAQIETGADYVYSWFEMEGGVDPFPDTHRTALWDEKNPRQERLSL